MILSCFRKNVDVIDVVSDIHRYPHAFSKVDRGADNQIMHSVVKLSTKPPVDQLLSSSWTNIDSMLLNGYSLDPIRDYIAPGLEESVAVVNSALDMTAAEAALLAKQPTPELTLEPTPEPTPEQTSN